MTTKTPDPNQVHTRDTSGYPVECFTLPNDPSLNFPGAPHETCGVIRAQRSGITGQDWISSGMNGSDFIESYQKGLDDEGDAGRAGVPIWDRRLTRDEALYYLSEAE